MAHEFRMPNVFVVPPVEDEIPSWCCFNASKPLADGNNLEHEHMEPSHGSIDDMDDESTTVRHSPRSTTLPRTNSDSQSVMDSLMSRDFNIDHTAADSDSELDFYESELDDDHHRRQQPQPLVKGPDSRSTTPGSDSDVIEVVKVSRSQRRQDDPNSQQPPPHGLKRSGTFKDKAKKAFRSFSGAFRPSKSREDDIASSRPSSRSTNHSPAEEHEHQAQEPPVPESLSRRPPAKLTRRLSKMFSVKSRSAITIHDNSSTDFVKVAPASDPSMSRAQTSEAPLVHDSKSQEIASSSDRAPSPEFAPDSVSSTRSAKRRLSRVGLNKLFSFSSNHQDVDTPSTTPKPSMDSGRSTPTLKRKSSSLPSTSSESSGPQTPTSVELSSTSTRSNLPHHSDTQLTSFGSGFGISPSDSSHPPLPSEVDKPEFDDDTSAAQEGPPLFRRYSTSSYRSSFDATGAAGRAPSPAAKRPSVETPLPAGDVSFEMQLDSLHFSELSFDAENFLIDDDRR